MLEILKIVQKFNRNMNISNTQCFILQWNSFASDQTGFDLHAVSVRQENTSLRHHHRDASNSKEKEECGGVYEQYRVVHLFPKAFLFSSVK